MKRRAPELSRRVWLKGAAALGTISAACPLQAAQVARPKAAAVFTEFRHRSHAFNFLINLMGKIPFRGRWLDPGVEVVSFYADQFPDGDMSREASQRLKVPLYPTIDQALCLGGKSLAVDAA